MIKTRIPWGTILYGTLLLNPISLKHFRQLFTPAFPHAGPPLTGSHSKYTKDST